MGNTKVPRNEWPEIFRLKAAGESFAGIGRRYGCSASAIRNIVNTALPLSARGQAENAAPTARVDPRGSVRAISKNDERQPPAQLTHTLVSHDALAAAQYASADVTRFLGALDATLSDRSQKNLTALLIVTEQLMLLTARIHQGIEALLGPRST